MIALSTATQLSIHRNLNFVFNPKSQIKKNAFSSYSVRKLNSTYYNGVLFRVRRSWDGALADVYCDEYGFEKAFYLSSSAQNITDRAQMRVWSSFSDFCITQWFDQTGAGYHLSQTVAFEQPQVLLFTPEGYPRIVFQHGSNLFRYGFSLIRDFSLVLYGDFAPQNRSISVPLAMLTVDLLSQTIFDTLLMNDVGLKTSSNGNARSNNVSVPTYGWHSVGWSIGIGDTYAELYLEGVQKELDEQYCQSVFQPQTNCFRKPAIDVRSDNLQLWSG